MKIKDLLVIEEAFRPMSVSFGINEPDFDDGKFDDRPKGSFTFFNSGGLSYYVYIMKNGEFGFGVSEEAVANAYRYSGRRREGRSAPNPIALSNQMIFIMLELLKHRKPQFLKFKAKEPRMGEVYARFVNSQFFRDELEAVGYKYEGEYKGWFIFKR